MASDAAHEPDASASSNDASSSRTQADIRLYGFRASYHLPAALSIVRESPVIHVAFVHPGDREERDETIMNIPLIGVCMLDMAVEGEFDEADERAWALYLHTHKQSGLVEAIQSGIKALTATTTKIDGMILSPTAHDHSLNYRSATLHLHAPLVLSDTDPSAHEEKRAALAEVTNTVTGYDRTRLVGEPNDPNVTRTTVIKCKIKAISCKQRYGAFSGGKEPVFDVPDGKEEDAFTGVVPCWTEWGKPLGYGRDEEEVREHFASRSKEAKAFADGVAWGSEAASLEGLGKKRRKPLGDE